MDEINYKIVGDGKTSIILMHEWMGDHTNYDFITPFIDKTKYRWIFVDFRGYGLSKSIKGDYNLEEACSDIKNLIDKLDIKKFHLLGHSMSSLIAQKLLLQLEKQIITISLITPILPTGIKMKEESKNRLLEDVKNSNGVIEQVVESAGKRYNNVWKNYRIDLAHNCSILEAKLGYMNMYLSNDFSNEIKSLDTNKAILVMTGKYDLPAFHKNSLQKEFVKYYKNIELLECQESGHYPMIEAPLYFVSSIENFICKYS